jgi:hypothetical protein
MGGFCSVGILMKVISESATGDPNPSPHTLDRNDPKLTHTGNDIRRCDTNIPPIGHLHRSSDVVRPHRPFYVANYHCYH